MRGVGRTQRAERRARNDPPSAPDNTRFYVATGGAAIVAAIASGGATVFFFYPPIYSFVVEDPQHLIELSLFGFVARLELGRKLAEALGRGLRAKVRASGALDVNGDGKLDIYSADATASALPRIAGGRRICSSVPIRRYVYFFGAASVAQPPGSAAAGSSTDPPSAFAAPMRSPSWEGIRRSQPPRGPGSRSRSWSRWRVPKPRS